MSVDIKGSTTFRELIASHKATLELSCVPQAESARFDLHHLALMRLTSDEGSLAF